MNILLVEDSAELREEISAFLSRRGWSVLCAGSLQEFEALMDQAGLAIIDIMLPDGSGFDAITRLRQSSPGAGIIALSARGSSDYVVQGLHDGADHYLVKPVKLIELEAVIVSLSRRVPTSWTLQSGARQLISPRGLALQLSRNEFTLVQLFAERPGVPVSRRAIVQAYGEQWLSYDQRRMDTLISRLRKRCRDTLNDDLPLKTEHGEGYSFTAPIVVA